MNLLKILIKGGHVIDLANNVDEIMDISLEKDKITECLKTIPETGHDEVIDAHNFYVTPGFIDIHSSCRVYYTCTRN